jgi:hypothetical protein
MSVPTIASITTASLTLNSAILGSTVTGSGITETGIAYSLTSINAAPVKGGIGVFDAILSPVAASGGLYTIAIANLLPGQSYTFNSYAINASGTSTANATVFVTPQLPTFGTTGTLATEQTIYVKLRNGDRETLTQIISAQLFGFQMLNGTYRDLFSTLGGANAGAGYPYTAFVATSLVGSSSGTPASTTPISVPDDVGHVPPRQDQWLESGVLFTDSLGMPYRFFDKDIYGWSNGLTSDAPTNITS